MTRPHDSPDCPCLECVWHDLSGGRNPAFVDLYELQRMVRERQAKQRPAKVPA